MDFFSAFVPPLKFAWKKEHPVFWLFLKISKIDLGPLKSKFFKSEKSTKSAMKKSTYRKNFKSFAQKLWFWGTNWYLFLGHPVCISRNENFYEKKFLITFSHCPPPPFAGVWQSNYFLTLFSREYWGKVKWSGEIIIYPSVGKYCFPNRDSSTFFSGRTKYERVLK